jgi:RHS repeat-associated protein
MLFTVWAGHSLRPTASLGTYEYTPYGEPYIATGLDLPQKFTGHWQIPQAGIYYAPYRMYSPGIARWLTRDPLGMVDGPNVYAYVRANPAMFSDPDGRIVTVLLAALGAFAVGCGGGAALAGLEDGSSCLGGDCPSPCEAACDAIVACAGGGIANAVTAGISSALILMKFKSITYIIEWGSRIGAVRSALSVTKSVTKRIVRQLDRMTDFVKPFRRVLTSTTAGAAIAKGYVTGVCVRWCESFWGTSPCLASVF